MSISYCNLFFLAGPHMWGNIQSQKAKVSKSNGLIHDIIDGKKYQELCKHGRFLHEKSNISFVFNTDGVCLYKSSKIEIWPVYLAINEVPPKAR